MKLKIGNPATGSDFFPRERVRSRLLRALARDHVAFVGPRRTGKTSILKNITQNPPPGTAAVFLDLEKFSTVPEWLTAMLVPTKALITGSDKAGWLAGSGKTAKTLLGRIERLEVLGNGITLNPDRSNPDAWRPLADEFQKLLHDADLPIYFLLDEFPWYLGHLARKHTAVEVEAVLNWFRSARQELAGGQTRFLVTGSIGLEGLLRRIGLSPTANDFDTIEIPPLAVRSMTNDELGFVIDTLRHDGYLLRRSDGQYQFASNILRDYWIHRTA